MPSANVKDIDAIACAVESLTSNVQTLVDAIATQGPPTQTIIHKTDGSGLMVGLCVACVMIMLGYVLFENRSFSPLLRAVETNKADIAALRMTVEKMKGDTK